METRCVVAPLLAATSLPLAACGGRNGAGADVEQQASAPITIWVDDTRTKPAQEYAAAHPELKAAIKSVDNPRGNIPAQIALAVKAGKEHPGYSPGSVNSRYGLNGYYGSGGCAFNESSSPTTVTIDVKSPTCTRVDESSPWPTGSRSSSNPRCSARAPAARSTAPGR